MQSCYVVMTAAQSPVAIIMPSPKVVFMTRKEADAYCKKHNDSSRTTTIAYVRKVQLNATN